MLSEVLLRAARPDEAHRLAAIGYAAWDQDLRPFLSGLAASRDNERRRLIEAVASYIRRIVVAELDGDAVGWCARGRGYVPYLFVDTDLQNQGIGTLLLKRSEALLELEGWDRVQLDTLADNVRAVRFYEHQGYRILAMKPDARGGSANLTGVRLEKRLHPFRGPVPDTD